MSEEPKQSKKTILLAEDDHSISYVYGLMLEINGYTVLYAYDGLAAVDILKDGQHIDLLLLDLLMPKITGDRVLEKMRSIDQYEETPVVVLTNLGREEAPKTLWHHRITRYVVKVNTSPREMASIVSDILT